MSQFTLFAQRLSEPRAKDGERPRLSTTEDVNRGNYKQLERDHRRHGITWQAKHRLAPANSEDGGPAGPDSHGIVNELSTQFAEHHFYQIVLSHGDAARNDKQICFQAAFDAATQFFFFVGSIAQQFALGSREYGKRLQGNAVAIANL